MPFSRQSWHLMLATLLALLIVACSPIATSQATEAVIAPEADTITEVGADVNADVEQAGAIGETIPGMADGQGLLTWIAPANRPGNQAAGTPGELVYFNPDGSTETVLTLPQGTTRVTECGPNGTSPDGSLFAFIVTVTGGGDESGTLYTLDGASTELTTIATDLNPASCVGSTPFEFSPDGSRFAFIDWSQDATNQVSPFGVLRIYDAASGSETASFENVTTFDLTDSGAVWVSFFPNDDGEATEVAIITWDGSVDLEVSSLVADEENDCYYNSASTAQVGAGLVAIMGYRCNRGPVTSTQWQFFNIDPTNRTAQLEQTDTAAGRYFVFSQTNQILPSTDGSTVLFTLPDGVSNQTVGLYSTAVDTVAPTELLNRSGVMPSVSDLPYDANNATARLSADGRFFALVVNTPDGDATLNVFDLSDPALPPITVDAGDRGDTIGAMVFNRSSDRLYYVAGSDEGGNNSIFALDLITGTESRIRRGRYAQMAISPDGNHLAAMNWVEYDPDEPRYLTLEIIDITTTAPTVIYEGGELDAEGDLINQSFAYPLAWRQG